MRSSSHTLDRVEVTFDDEHAVADAGLILPATLAQRLGVEALADELVGVGHRWGRKVLTVVHALAAGADCIDDADILRSGATARVLGHDVMAPSTIGTWLRSFTFGHVRQLDRLSEQLLTRAWAAGAGPGDGELVIDVDSTICQIHGYAKQGATFGYTRVRGYHPLLATRADSGEMLHVRMRKGSANSGRGRSGSCAKPSAGSAVPAQPDRSCCAPTPGSGPTRSSTPAPPTTCATPSLSGQHRRSKPRSTGSATTPGSTSTTPTAAAPRSLKRCWVSGG